MWLLIFTAAFYHEMVCEDGQFLSQVLDRKLPKYWLPIYAFTAITLAHLFNKMPPRADPYVWAGVYVTRKETN